MKKLLLAGMIFGLVGTGTAYTWPTLNASDEVQWTQIASEEEDEGEDQGTQEGDEGQGGDQGEEELSPEEEEPST